VQPVCLTEGRGGRRADVTALRRSFAFRGGRLPPSATPPGLSPIAWPALARAAAGSPGPSRPTRTSPRAAPSASCCSCR